MALNRDTLMNNKLIRTRENSDGVISYNFTRQAFMGGLWDDTTIHARGLFMRGDTIVARGYDKFFNMGEDHGYTYEDIVSTFTYPIHVSKKRNGFLGIICADKGVLKLYSKSGETDYSAEAMKLFTLTDDEREYLVEILTRYNTSLTVEVVLPRDPHIIDEPCGLYALDVIPNTENFVVFDEIRRDIEKHVSCFAPKTEWLVTSRDELIATLNKYTSNGIHEEGIVLRDKDNRMSKIKTPYYLKVKRLRTPLTRILHDKATLEELTTAQDEHGEVLNIYADMVYGFLKHSGNSLERYTVTSIGGTAVVDIPRLMADSRAFARRHISTLSRNSNR